MRAIRLLAATTTRTSKVKILPKKILAVISNRCGIATMTKLSNLLDPTSLLSGDLPRMRTYCFTRNTIYKTCITIIMIRPTQVNVQMLPKHQSTKLGMVFMGKILMFQIKGTPTSTMISIPTNSVKWWKLFTEAGHQAFSSRSKKEETQVTIWISLNKFRLQTKPWWRFRAISERVKLNPFSGWQRIDPRDQKLEREMTSNWKCKKWTRTTITRLLRTIQSRSSTRLNHLGARIQKFLPLKRRRQTLNQKSRDLQLLPKGQIRLLKTPRVAEVPTCLSDLKIPWMS